MTPGKCQRVMALALLMVLAGCASTGPIFQSMPNRMDGLFLTITAEKPNNSIAVYDITQDGTLSFAGGAEAKRGETAWSTALSAKQRERMMEMIEDFGWLRSGPASVGENSEHEYKIAIRRGGSRQRYTVQGDNPQVKEMVDFLDEICMQRFDEYLDRLPRAGEAPR